MTTPTTTAGGSTPDLSPQVSQQDSAQYSSQDSIEILAAAQKLRSEEVGRVVTIAARVIGRTIKPVLRAINEFFTRRQEMAELMRLNDRELADIGLSRGDLYAARRSHDRVHVPANENIPRSVA